MLSELGLRFSGGLVTASTEGCPKSIPALDRYAITSQWHSYHLVCQLEDAAARSVPCDADERQLRHLQSVEPSDDQAKLCGPGEVLKDPRCFVAYFQAKHDTPRHTKFEATSSQRSMK